MKKTKPYVHERLIAHVEVVGQIEAYSENHAKIFVMDLIEKGICKKLTTKQLNNLFKDFMDGK